MVPKWQICSDVNPPTLNRIARRRARRLRNVVKSIHLAKAAGRCREPTPAASIEGGRWHSAKG